MPEFLGILKRYGSVAAVSRGGEVRTGLAMVQPVLEKEEQWTPTALGHRRRDRFLCLGEPGLAADRPEEGACVEWDGRAYDVVSEQPVKLGGKALYWWAVLEPREDEVGT